MEKDNIIEQCKNIKHTIINGIKICKLRVYDEKDMYSSLLDFLFSYHTIFYTFPRTSGKTTALKSVSKKLGYSIIFSKDNVDNKLIHKYHNNNRWNDLVKDELRNKKYNYIFFDSCDIEKTRMCEIISHLNNNGNITNETIFIVVE